MRRAGFDKPISLQKLSFDGKISGGKLVGDIRILSAGGNDSESGGDDEETSTTPSGGAVSTTPVFIRSAFYLSEK